MQLADLTSYVEHRERLAELYAGSGGWAREAILVPLHELIPSTVK